MKHRIDHLQNGLTLSAVKSAGLLMAALFFVAPLQSVYAQTAEDALLFTQRLPATGARSLGLAGAGKAGIGDYSAFYTNPAGLGYLNRSQVSAGFKFLSTTDDALMAIAGTNSSEELTDQSLGNLTGAFKVPTKQGSMVVGIAFNQTNTFDRSLFFQGEIVAGSISNYFYPFPDEFDVFEENGAYFPEFIDPDLMVIQEIAYQGGAIEFLGEFYDPSTGSKEGLFDEAVKLGSTIEVTSEVFEEGRMKDFSFGGAVEVARGVMVGGALNFSVGTYEFENIYDEFDVNGENTQDDYIIFNGDDVLSGFDFMRYESSFKSDLVGANLRVGVSAEATNNVRVGLTIETPTFYRLDEIYDTIISTEFDSGGSLIYGGLPGDDGHGSYEYDITTPWRFGAGLSYNVSGLTLMADIEFIDWTKLELDADTDLDQNLFNGINRTIRRDFQGVVNTRLAGEYRLNDLMVRGGVAFQPDPIEEPLTGADGSTLDRDKTFISAGLGYRFSDRFVIDFGWMQERQDDVFAPDFVDYLVDEEVVRNHFLVGVSVLF